MTHNFRTHTSLNISPASSLASSLAIATLALQSLTACQTQPTKSEAAHPTSQMTMYSFSQLPPMGDSEIPLGGFSGLSYLGKDPATGRMLFKTHTDRGPNLEPIESNKSKQARPFLMPAFQPEWIEFSFDSSKGELSILSRQPLTKTDGQPLTGLPNKPSTGEDEFPVGPFGETLASDPLGLDLESIALDQDGSYWMTEEYRPSILHFSSKGRLISRWIPKDQDKAYGEGKLPSYYASRKSNRGFEGIALGADSVFAFAQSPLKGDKGLSRVLQVNKTTGEPVAEFAYPFEPTPEGLAVVDKIGDAHFLTPQSLLVVEQNGGVGEKGFHRVYEVDLRDATNILGRRPGDLTTEKLCASNRKTETTTDCIHPLKKTLVADLVALGWKDVEKIEGLAVIDPHTIALVNDNDFGITGTIQAVDSPLKESPSRRSWLKPSRSDFVLIHLKDALY